MAREREPWEYWEDYCEEEEKYRELCPVCELCGEHITEETYLDIDGRTMHRDCCRDEYEKWTDDFARGEADRRGELLHG